MPYVPPPSFETLLEKHEMISSLVKRLTSGESEPTDMKISSLIKKLDNHKSSITAHLKLTNSYSDGLTNDEATLKTLLNTMVKQVEQHIENTKTHVDQQKSDDKDHSVRNGDVISSTHNPLHGPNN